MRVGFNPNKDKPLEKSNYNHQVIVPVYIPNQEGYFKDSFQILQYCLESLFKTSHSKTYFTIVNNGSCQEIVNYINQLLAQGDIQEVINTTAIGKLNAISKGLTGHQFDLITITDADVLFMNDWQKATYEVFESFTKAGVVSTTPSSKVLKQHTQNTVVANLFSSKLCFTNVVDEQALKMFANSIGNAEFYNEVHLKKYLTITSGNCKAIVGASHFVATYRGTIFSKLNNRFTSFALGGTSESLFLDKPATDVGYWRLSTEVNYTCHLGNVVEPWMNTKLKTISKIINNNTDLKFLENTGNTTVFVYFNKIIFKLLSYPRIWKMFLKYKGLTQAEANKY